MQNLPAASRYSSVAIWLHWLIALALAGQIALGFSMPRDASGFALYQLHKSVGITILVLSVVRLLWRFAKPRPAPLEGGFNGFLAGAVHWGFYGFMILGPLTGWALVSTAPVNVPTLIFGVIPLPHLPLGGDHEIWEEAHEILAFVGMALFVLHVAGALRHHFLIRDGLLARMAPAGKPGLALLLGAGVIAIWALVPRLVGVDGREGPERPIGAGADAATSAPLAEPVAETSPVAEETPAAEASEAAAADDEPEAGPPPQWAIAPGGSLGFGVENAGYALNGSFRRWSGTITMDPDSPDTAAIAIEIDLASGSMGDATQDAMLQGANFFNTAAHPTARWRSTAVRALGGGRYQADGTLTLHGTSRPQRIAFTLEGDGASRFVNGTASINRTAFGVGTGEDAAGIAANVAVNFAFTANRR